MVYGYSPYGEQSSETIEDSQAGELNAFGYTGAYQFLDGTVHLPHRFLDTFTLNFTQPDPSRQEMNNFTYAECDPINNTDPTGLMAQCVAAKAGQTAVTGGVAVGIGGAITGAFLGPGAGISGAVGFSAGFYGGLAAGTLDGLMTC